MYIYTHTYMYTCIPLYIQIHVWGLLSPHMHTNTCIHIHANTCMLNIRTDTCILWSAWMATYAHIHTYIHVYMHTYMCATCLTLRYYIYTQMHI